MTKDYYKQYEPVFGTWRITKPIGEGCFSKVFEIQRLDFGLVYKAALKAITIPQDPAQVRHMLDQGEDEAQVRSYFLGVVQEMVKKFILAYKLKDHPNIVNYENYQVMEHKNGIGWDILIQMELLTPLNRYLRQQTLSRQEVIKLGIDLCKALELCWIHNIVHRDIKPGNIFVSKYGDFKLGDFDTAQVLDRSSSSTSSGSTVRGTYDYMAPEVYRGEKYGFSADLYSLGLVLYQLLNDNRLPFLPAAPAPFTYVDQEKAKMKRLSGAALPMPSHADKRLWEIVEKACAYNPEDRYSDPVRLREALEQVDASSPTARAGDLLVHAWPKEWRTSDIASFALSENENQFICDGNQVVMKQDLERDGRPLAPIEVQLTPAQREALWKQLESIQQEGWAMTGEQTERLNAFDYTWNKCFQCQLVSGRKFQYCSNDDVPQGFTALYDFLYSLAFPQGSCPENAHAFVPAVLRGGWNSGPKECLYCENCGLVVPLWIANTYPGSKIRGVAYTWPAAWQAEDILSFSVGFGDRPIRCFTCEGDFLTAVNRIDVGRDGGLSFPPGYFDPISIHLSGRQQKQLRRCLEAIGQERWSSDTTALQYEFQRPTGYTRHTYFCCELKNGEKFEYLPGEEPAPGFTHLCRCLETILPWKEAKSDPGFWNRLFRKKS